MWARLSQWAERLFGWMIHPDNQPDRWIARLVDYETRREHARAAAAERGETVDAPRGSLYSWAGLALGLGIGWCFLPGATPPPLEPGQTITQIDIDKSGRMLYVLQDGEILRAFTVAMGHISAQTKTSPADHRIPEGRYTLQHGAGAGYEHALVIGPDADLAPNEPLVIHGLPPDMRWIKTFHRIFDWTEGGFGLTDGEFALLWDQVKDGTPIQIRRDGGAPLPPPPLAPPLSR